MKKWGWWTVPALLGLSILAAFACAAQPPPGPPLTVPQLKYVLIDKFPGLFYVDTDFYPVARVGAEDQHALELFPAIQANSDEFTAILNRLGLGAKANYNGEEKLLIYREHKKLTSGVQLTTAGGIYNFSLRTGENQGELIEGTITPSGQVTVTKREPSFNTRPICLARGTLIDTPSGKLPVEQIHTGMEVWTTNVDGGRVPATVIETSSTPVPASFEMVRIGLEDGRSIAVSPGHPSAELRALGSYRVGEMLDGARIVTMEHIIYDGGATNDLLPDSPTGLYRANGVLLKSTLAKR
jgi:hypothetical protein